MNNQELVQKATITTDAIAASGKLNPQQADRFIDYVFDLTGLKNNARTIRFRNEEAFVDKIGVGKRAAMPATEAVSPSLRRGVSTSRVTLKPAEIIVPFEISDTFQEINLEGGDVEDRIMRMFATQLANDTETLYIEGDTLGRAVPEGDVVDGGHATNVIKDAYLALFNGWLRRADSGNIVDAANQNIGSNLFSRAINAMPAKFKRNRADLRFMTSLDLEQNFREKVSTRATQAGDNALETKQNLTPYGIPLAPFNLYPFKYREVEHVTLVNAATAAALRRKPVANVTVTLATLGATATTPFVETTDYTVDLAAGTITKVGAAIPDGTLVKVTYDANPTLLLTHYTNLIVGIGRDIRIERDRDIYRRVNQFAITLKVAVEVEEVDALVKVTNVGTGV